MIESLCKEYLDLIDRMDSGGYSPEEIREMDAERMVLHAQLIELTKLARRDDMYQFCRGVMFQARMEGRE